MKKLLNRIKTYFKNLLYKEDQSSFIGAIVSSYYISLGILLAIATQSVVFLIIFVIPAAIWYIVSIISWLGDSTVPCQS